MVPMVVGPPDWLMKGQYLMGREAQRSLLRRSTVKGWDRVEGGLL